MRKLSFIIALMMVSCVVFAGCKDKETVEISEPDEIEMVDETVDDISEEVTMGLSGEETEESETLDVATNSGEEYDSEESVPTNTEDQDDSSAKSNTEDNTTPTENKNQGGYGGADNWDLPDV